MVILSFCKVVPDVFESIGVKDITGAGLRARYATKCFEAGVPDKLTTLNTRHMNVETLRKNYIKENAEQRAAVSDAVRLDGGAYVPPKKRPLSPQSAEKLKEIRRHVPGFVILTLYLTLTLTLTHDANATIGPAAAAP